MTTETTTVAGGRRSRRIVVALLVVLALLVAACGQVGAGSDSPDPVAQPTPIPTPDTTGPPLPDDPIPVDLATLVDVYFVGDEALVPVPRPVEWDDLVANAVDALLDGPTVDEARRGLSTSLDPDVELNAVEIVGRVATADLSGDFHATADDAADLRLRLAQVVYTLTEFPEISKVVFELDGEPVAGPWDGGIDVSRGVDRSYFAGLFTPAPAPAPGPTPTLPTPPPTWDDDDLADLEGDHGSWPAWVTLVAADDLLNVRRQPGVAHPIVGRIEPGTRLTASDSTAAVGSSTWVAIVTPIGPFWVNGHYLVRDHDRDDFAADHRVDGVLAGLSQTFVERGDLRPVVSDRGLYLDYNNGELVRYRRSQLESILSDPSRNLWPVPDGVNPEPPQTVAEAVGDHFRAVFAYPDTVIAPNEWDPGEADQPISGELRAFPHVGVFRSGVELPDSGIWYVSFDYERGQPVIVGLTLREWTP